MVTKQCFVRRCYEKAINDGRLLFTDASINVYKDVIPIRVEVKLCEKCYDRVTKHMLPVYQREKDNDNEE